MSITRLIIFTGVGYVALYFAVRLGYAVVRAARGEV